MKKILSLVITVILLVSVCGCSDNSLDTLSRDYIAMDTIFSIRTGKLPESTDTDKETAAILDGCEELIVNIENVLSVTKEGSEVNSFNTGVTALFDADPIFTDVMNTAFLISDITDSAFDPTIGALTTLWNVKGGGPVPTENEINSAKAASGIDSIEIKHTAVYKTNPAIMLDFGGIGKGYATQRLAEYLFESGIPYGIISAGRNVGVFGEKPDGSSFKIGIADPKNSDGVVGYLYTDGAFISVAGDYEQYFEENGVRYHHIIDPATGYPSDSGLSSVAVISQNGTAADALSTALMVMGYDRGIELYGSGKIPFEAIFIFSSGTVKYTDGLGDGKFEMNDSYDPSAYTAEDKTTTADATAK